jgi:hypothetical protein
MLIIEQDYVRHDTKIERQRAVFSDLEVDVILPLSTHPPKGPIVDNMIDTSAARICGEDDFRGLKEKEAEARGGMVGIFPGWEKDSATAISVPA